MKIVDHLDVNFNLNDGNYKYYTNPSNEIKYIHKDSNDPPNLTIHRIMVIYPVLKRKKHFKKHYPLPKRILKL